MASQSDRAPLPDLVAELTRALVGLRGDLRSEQRRRPRGRRLDQLLQLTTDVTIPATILLLETNIRALRLLQRTLRIAGDDASAATTDSDAVALGEDAATVGRTVVDRLDDALGDVQAALETEADPQARDRLAEARDLNRELEDRLAELSAGTDAQTAEVDVEGELASLKDEYDDASDANDADDANDTDDADNTDGS